MQFVPVVVSVPTYVLNRQCILSQADTYGEESAKTGDSGEDW